MKALLTLIFLTCCFNLGNIASANFNTVASHSKILFDSPFDGPSGQDLQTYKRFEMEILAIKICSKDNSIGFKFDQFGNDLLFHTISGLAFYQKLVFSIPNFAYLKNFNSKDDSIIKSEGMIIFIGAGKAIFRPNQTLNPGAPDTQLSAQNCSGH